VLERALELTGHQLRSDPRLPATCVSIQEIRLVDVSYRYADAVTDALDGVDLHLLRGSRTAIVGPTGAGKTTLVQLLLRFLEPTRGAIYADGRPIAELTAHDWRRQVAIVPQQPYLFAASAFDNLRLARPDASLDAVRHAAELAGAHQFLKCLPDGYDTPLGERGARLSRGQAQRLAIARAFLKNAAVLILDEPTSALDLDSERVVRKSLEQLADSRTVVVVAHRLETVVTADRIAVLRAGKVVEFGTHADLVDQAGLYATFVSNQAITLAVA
jgi:ABC-type multidrug transport system fused ATPase/permease subunit